MTRLSVLSLVLIALSSEALFAQTEARDLAVTIEVAQSVPLGSLGVPLAVVLQNNGSRSVEVLTPDTARFELRVTDADEAGPARVIRIDRTERSSSAGGLTTWARAPERSVALAPKGVIKYQVEESYISQPFIGKYVIRVVLPSGQEGKGSFEVVLDIDRTVPLLIDLIDGRDFESLTRYWARELLFSITGQPTWGVSRQDQEDLTALEQRIRELRTWWTENKSLLKVEGSRLIPK